MLNHSNQNKNLIKLGQFQQTFCNLAIEMLLYKYYYIKLSEGM